jgi:peptide/nickel transport system permease protein
MISPVILWTDALVFFLLGLIAAGLFNLRRNRQLKEQWRSVFRSRVGSGAFVVLMFYVVIGLLDSLHYHPLDTNADGTTSSSPEVISVLDNLLNDLRKSTEKSYSAPFATTLYVKENIEVNGVQQRIYPPLEKRARHLDANESVLADSLQKGLLGSLLGLLGGVAIVQILALLSGQSLRQVVFRQDTVQWRSISLTILVAAMLLGAVLNLSLYYHVLGTDKVGQDVLYLSLKSVRTGLVIGTLTTLIMLPFAIFLGIMAGYYRSWVDDVIQYVYTTLNSIPGILLIAASVLMLQVLMDNNPEAFASIEERSDARLFFLCMILGITSWTGLCRLLRGETLKLRELDFIQAARALGTPNITIITRHILPNLMHIVLISVVLDFSGLVLAEAVLAYVEIGVDPSMNSWGNMINSARLEMSREPIVWWSLFAAFCFMFILVLAANLFSDAVRDAFDPRLRAR